MGAARSRATCRTRPRSSQRTARRRSPASLPRHNRVLRTRPPRRTARRPRSTGPRRRAARSRAARGPRRRPPLHSPPPCARRALRQERPAPNRPRQGARSGRSQGATSASATPRRRTAAYATRLFRRFASPTRSGREHRPQRVTSLADGVYRRNGGAPAAAYRDLPEELPPFSARRRSIPSPAGCR